MTFKADFFDLSHGRTLIATTAAKMIVEDGVRDYGQAKRKALRTLKLPPNTPLPDDGEIDMQLRIHLELYQDDEQRARIAYLREKAIEIMEKMKQFTPYLTGSVLDGTAGPYAEIDIQLFPDSAKEVEIFLLNQKIEYQHSAPRSERAEAVLTVQHEEAVANLIIYPPHDERVTFKAKDGRIRQRIRLDALKKLLKDINPIE